MRLWEGYGAILSPVKYFQRSLTLGVFNFAEDPEEPGLGKVGGKNPWQSGKRDFLFLFHFTSTVNWSANEKTEKKWRRQQANSMEVYCLNITFEFCTHRQYNNGVCLFMEGRLRSV